MSPFYLDNLYASDHVHTLDMNIIDRTVAQVFVLVVPLYIFLYNAKFYK